MATLPVWTGSNGYSLSYIIVAPDTMQRIQAKIAIEHRDSLPQAPVVRQEIGPNAYRDHQDTDDPTYKAALAAWEAKVRREFTRRWSAFLLAYALRFEIDTVQVARLRAAMAEAGDDLSNESDAEIWVWRIVAPTTAEQTELMKLVLGVPIQTEVAAARESFRGDVARA